MPWLTIIWQWLLRLVGGWLPLGNKPIGEWLGKVLWAMGISVAVFFLLTSFKGCKKETPTAQNQKAGGSITNYNYTIKPRFGCATIRGLK